MGQAHTASLKGEGGGWHSLGTLEILRWETHVLVAARPRVTLS